MRVWPVAAGRFGWLRVMAEGSVPRTRNPAPRVEAPLRTVFNSYTGQYEDMPLPEFQLLLRQGKIQETVKWREDRPPRYVYRLV
jgi:hypothetical protein